MIALTGCGWLPPDSPPAKPVPPDPDAALLHAWKITGHVLGPRALLSELDAAAFDGRTIAITATGYSSPWSGSCDDAGRQKQPCALADITAELNIARERVTSSGLGDPLVEYRLSCGPNGTGRAPSLTLYVSGADLLERRLLSARAIASSPTTPDRICRSPSREVAPHHSVGNLSPFN